MSDRNYALLLGQRLVDYNSSNFKGPKNNGIIGQCVWHVRGCAFDAGVNPGITGNANVWFNSAKQKGLAAGNEPKPESIACFNFGQYGHVLYIHDIIGSIVYYSEANSPMDNKLSPDDGICKAMKTSDLINKAGYQGCIYLKPELSAKPEPTQTPSPSGHINYTVVKGDTLSGIALKFFGNGSRYPEIKTLNGLKSDTIYAGQVLKIPVSVVGSGNGNVQSPPAVERTYTVVRGDSLWAIASRLLGNGSRYPEIKALNGLKSDVIRPGQVLKIPAKQ